MVLDMEDGVLTIYWKFSEISVKMIMVRYFSGNSIRDLWIRSRGCPEFLNRTFQTEFSLPFCQNLGSSPSRLFVGAIQDGGAAAGV